MTVKATIEQGVIAWLQAGSTPPVAGGLGAPLTDAQVILAERSKVRPPLPYLTVKVTVPGVVVGAIDERIDSTSGGGTPQVSIQGARRASVSVNAFGAGAVEWVSEAILALSRTLVRPIIDAAGLTIDPIGDGTNLSRVLDTGFEDRVLYEFEVQYKLNTTGRNK